MSLQVSRLNFGYAGQSVLNEIDLAVPAGEMLAIVGPSGGGKSTLLKAIAGLIRVDQGDILIAGKSVRSVRPHLRDVSMMFQGESLYPHLTIHNGIKCTLSGSKVDSQIMVAAKRFGGEDFLDRYPHQLSGGQRRRCGLAKIAAQTKLIRLLDEPLSGLDHPIADQIASDLTLWHQEHPGITVLVTHDVRHAHRFADRMAVIDDGRILQCDRPSELMRNPRHQKVAIYASPEPMQWIGASEAHEVPLSTITVNREKLRIGFQARHCQPKTSGRLAGELMIRPDNVSSLGNDLVELTIGKSTVLAVADRGNQTDVPDSDDDYGRDVWCVGADHWNAFDQTTGLAVDEASIV